ncbi:MAG: DUF6285 domain-containing protein [Alphaproteobacteria bacterium]
MEDSPTARELVTAVREFIEERLAPTLEGHTAFHARVAVNALGIVERQLDQGPGAEAREHERLKTLLGEDADLASLNQSLALAIRDGRLSLDDPALIDHLRATTVDKVMIDQPRYSGLRDALAAGLDGSGSMAGFA